MYFRYGTAEKVHRWSRVHMRGGNINEKNLHPIKATYLIFSYTSDSNMHTCGTT